MENKNSQRQQPLQRLRAAAFALRDSMRPLADFLPTLTIAAKDLAAAVHKTIKSVRMVIDKIL